MYLYVVVSMSGNSVGCGRLEVYAKNFWVAHKNFSIIWESFVH